MSEQFNKPYLNPSDLVSLLKERGLIIQDDSRVMHYLTNIGYYRLSAYMHPFIKNPKDNKQFKENTTFDKVMRLYRFDRKLRLLIFNELEKIEIAIRSIIIKFGCEFTKNKFWITDSSNFLDGIRYSNSISLINKELNRSHEDFIIQFKKRFENNYPPAWILAEILPFGLLTNLYSNLKDSRIKKGISQYFGLQIKPFESWLSIIVGQRNSCCHHARVWNRHYSTKVTLPKKVNNLWISNNVDTQHVYFSLCIIKYFLNIISPNNDFTQKLISLLSTYPEIDLYAMGFQTQWIDEPLWKS